MNARLFFRIIQLASEMEASSPALEKSDAVGPPFSNLIPKLGWTKPSSLYLAHSADHKIDRFRARRGFHSKWPSSPSIIRVAAR